MCHGPGNLGAPGKPGRIEKPNPPLQENKLFKSEKQLSPQGHLLLHLALEFLFFEFFVLRFGQAYFNALTLQVQPIQHVHGFTSIVPLGKMNEGVV